MNWLNPALLAGLGGAAIPVIIHLLQRKRAPEHPFPAFDLLMAGRKRVAPHVRLRHILVMALRVFCVLAFACALALPYLRPKSAAALSDSPTACLVLLDDSLSMQYRDADEGLNERARRHADELLGRLRSFDAALVQTFSGHPVGAAGFTSDFASLRAALREAPPGYGRLSAQAALKRALSTLETQKLQEKLLVVLSDMTRGTWADEDLSLLAGSPVRVEVPNLWHGGDPKNHFIEALDLEVSREAVKVKAAVAATGARTPPSLPCTFELEGGRTATAAARLGADGRGTVELSGTPPGGWFAGELRLPPDALMPDNVRYVCGRSTTRIRVLLVDGDPREGMHASESFYLDLAMRGGVQEQNVETQVIGHHDLPGLDLSPYDCVILANVPAESLREARKLVSFVEAGGGLWILPGDQVNARACTERLDALLPADLSGVQKADPAGGPERLAVESERHPIFSVFEGQWLLKFGDAAFQSWWSLGTRPGSQVLARFSRGGPALVERDVGAGRVLLMAGPLDRDWNDLCIQPVFVPFVHQCVRHLVRAFGYGAAQNLTVGDTFRLNVRESAGSIHVLRPGESARWAETPLEEGDGGRSLAVADTSRPGVYRVAVRPDARSTIALFAVNVDTRESDLRRLERADVERVLDQKQEAAPGARVHGGGAVRLWPLLLWFALGALVAESILARK